MPAEKETLQLLQSALEHSTADQTEVLVITQKNRLTRFANSVIHQNLSELSPRVTVRAVIGKRVACASSNRLTREGVQATAEDASRLATVAEENPDFVSLPPAQPTPRVPGYFETTAAFSAQQSAQVVKDIAALARDAGCSVSGAFSVTEYEIAVANSLGVRAYQTATEAVLRVIATESGAGLSGYEAATGFAYWAGRDISALDHAAVARRALDKCAPGRNPQAIDPDDYTVILEPEAVGELLAFLGYIGFSATAVQEQRSFLCGRLGEKVMHESISIWDDGLDPRGLPLPFDFEGVPKQRVDLIVNGVARGIVYDSYTANREGKQSTGHALPAPNTYGPIPMNVFVSTGSHSIEEMISSTERGLLVTRFHYVNVVHPKQTVLTGMTRDGTFLIEGGRITTGVKNLRFTQNVVQALGGVLAVGDRAVLTEARAVVPALKLASFSFTSRA